MDSDGTRFEGSGPPASTEGSNRLNRLSRLWDVLVRLLWLVFLGRRLKAHALRLVGDVSVHGDKPSLSGELLKDDGRLSFESRCVENEVHLHLSAGRLGNKRDRTLDDGPARVH